MVLLLFAGSAVAEYSFERVSMEDGLSSNAVLFVHQDFQGLIWIGTRDGLNRYDGHNIRRYYSGIDDVQMPDFNSFRFAQNLRDGGLWFGPHLGDGEFINRFDLGSEKFETLEDAYGPREGVEMRKLSSGLTDGLDRTWVGNRTGLYQFDFERGNFEKVEAFESGRRLPSMAVTDIAEGARGELWVCGGYLWNYNPETKESRMFRRPNQQEGRIVGDYFRAAYVDSDEVVWIAHNLGGVFRLDPVSGDFEEIPILTKSGENNEPIVGVSILADDLGTLWLGTLSHGLFRYNQRDKRFKWFNIGLRGVDSDRMEVRHLFKDESGVLWVSSAMDGAIKIAEEDRRLRWHDLGDETTGNERFKGVADISIDREGKIWIATQPEGELIRLDRRFQVLDRIAPLARDNKNFALYDMIWTRGGKLIIAGEQGPELVDVESGDRRLIDFESNKTVRFIRCLYEDEEGLVWAANNSALGICNVDTVEFEDLSERYAELVEQQIRSMVGLGDGRLVFGTQSGAYILEKSTGDIRKLSMKSPGGLDLSSVQVNGLFRDSEGRLYLSTLSGLGIYDKDLSEFISFGAGSGLGSSQVLGLHESEDGRILLLTEASLLEYFPGDSHFEALTRSGSVVSDLFNAFDVDQKGNVIIASKRGLYSYDEERRSTTYSGIPRIEITRFSKLGKTIPRDGIEMEDGRAIVRHDENSLSIEFALIDFVRPERTRYAYILEGFDRGWSRMEGRNRIDYTSLPAGDYTFRVKGLGSNGEWSEEARFGIRALPPFWSTNWFYLLVFVLMSASIYGFILRRERKLKSDRVRLAGMVEAKTKELETHKEQLETTVEIRTKELVTARDAAEASQTKAEAARLHAEEAQTETKKALARATESDRLKSQFLANLSHEIRTPLNAITGFTSLMSDGDVDDDERSRFSDIVSENSDSLLTLIDDILDFSLIEANQLKIEAEVFSLNGFIDNVYSSFALRENEKKIEFRIDNKLDEDELHLVGDRSRIKQVIDNLMTNAYKFTEKGFVSLTVLRKLDTVCFSIEDSGPGIPEQEFELIFETFVKRQVDDIAARRGVGLGLTISKRLSQLMDGDLEVESEVGKGSIFTLSLPMRLACAPRSEERVEAELRKAGKGRVLVIEDEPANYQYLEACLLRMGLESVVADSGEKGIAALESNGVFDLVLLDIKMPGVDGYETLKRVRAINPTLKVIAQTAYATKSDENRIQRAGFDGYLAKPIKFEALVDALESSLTRA